jgi:predicted amidophosphoribosyltransferase
MRMRGMTTRGHDGASLRRAGILASTAGILGEVAHGLVDAALPQTCVACNQWLPSGTGVACQACHDQISHVIALAYCSRCGRTLPRSAIHEEGCARCKSERDWNVAGVARVGLYVPAIRALTVGLKYRGHERMAGYMASWLAAALRERGWLPDLEALVPVPMHWLRRAQRPCDHARVLADALGQHLGIPVVQPVQRTKHSPSQIGLTSRLARFENVKGCFGPRRRYLPWWTRPDVHGKTVCIVDNLMSTGATIIEVSKVLRRAGAKPIYAAVIARPAAPGDPRMRIIPESGSLAVPPVFADSLETSRTAAGGIPLRSDP